MKKTALIIAIFVMLLGVYAPADAAPSLNGPTGIINIPSADVLREGQFSLGAYRIKDGQIGSVTINAAPNLEIGWSGRYYKSSTGLSNKNRFNAKFAITSETILTPGVAVGIEDIGNAEKRSYYISASKGLIWGLRFHAGFGNGHYDGVFAAIEKSVIPVNIGGIGGTNLIVEWDSKHLNYGIRKAVAPGVKVDAGVRKKHGYLGVTLVN